MKPILSRLLSLCQQHFSFTYLTHTWRNRVALGLAPVLALGALVSFAAGAGANANPLSTEGPRIVDSEGREVRISGINWLGMDTADFAPHGLWARRWESMLDQIVKLGFNTVRIPYSTAMFETDSRARTINYALNGDLNGKSPLEILDKLVEGAGKRGLRVILARQSIEPGDTPGLWYSATYDEQRWIGDWRFLAERYKGNSTVIGADLHNEPHLPATWGNGDPATDWRLAAERAGNAIHEVNADWLIFVEGIDFNDAGWYWWGGNLSAVRDHPVRLEVPNKLVYSPHDFGPGVWPQPWFAGTDFPANLARIWERYWDFIPEATSAPLLVGQGGAPLAATETEKTWLREMQHHLKAREHHYVFWSLNPNSVYTGGLLLDDWQTVDEAKLALLKQYQAPLIR